ncbi:hypothetical protein [Campylobacter sp.]|uniref:hypothetical protein n=1 Tax=Campylobacter sp. TaxID=205 RepID=UPI0026DCDF83|nr:hypothetical protein [Campylobacter sp.]MDO4674890.1 hypothetical protein [Campylobacter sp.]
MARIILLSFLTICLSACGTNSVVNSVKIERVKIPAELLEIPPLSRPQVSNELEILNAYSLLFYHYKRCTINMEQIKKLNEGGE